MQNTEKGVDIKGILQPKRVITHFQPIVSIKKNSVIGFEALSRGLVEGGDALIPPRRLFEAAEKQGLAMELDSLCRARAFESYGSMANDPDRFILTVNLDPSTLREESSGSKHLLALAESVNMQPEKVLIEIIESRIGDITELEKLVSLYRGYGFLIAFDDMGTGLSNLDRVAVIKPDIVKIDTSLVQDSEKMYHSREIVKSLVSLAHRIGSLVIAEGVETGEQAVNALELGVDMLQGHHFAGPAPAGEDLTKGIAERMESVAANFKQRTVQRINDKKFRHRSYNRIINNLISELSRIPEEEYDTALRSLIKPHSELECVYILDEDGIQLSDTIFSVDGGGSKGFFFQPGSKGTDQSSKDYFFLLSAGLPKYTTAPYISLASRNVCITVSVAYRDADFRKRILCMDIIQDNGISG
ncbi:MAG TPA: EAL domain-containing protein [Spirochaetota bacterium]|nr:EAL domain-containing protein [Spirochaetota bacterium]HPO44706.1 EAL domain-containing protein [Spirochaetota bacterium]